MLKSGNAGIGQLKSGTASPGNGLKVSPFPRLAISAYLQGPIKKLPARVRTLGRGGIFTR